MTIRYPNRLNRPYNVEPPFLGSGTLSGLKEWANKEFQRVATRFRSEDTHQHSLDAHICLSSFLGTPQRVSAIDFNGFMIKVADAQAVSTGSPFTVNGGQGKLVFAVIAGDDVSGTLILSGTSVNRVTGDQLGSDSEILTVNRLSIDGGDTDAQGNVRYSLVNAYITKKWWHGDVVVSTTSLDLSDVDVYAVAFEQFGDHEDITLDTFDITVKNIAAGAPAEWMYSNLYSVITGPGDYVRIKREATLVLDPTPNKGVPYRLRIGNIGTELNGTRDGIFVSTFFGPTVVNEWENFNLKVWAHIGDYTT